MDLLGINILPSSSFKGAACIVYELSFDAAGFFFSLPLVLNFDARKARRLVVK